MERIVSTPRPDYQAKLEAQGLSFHSWDAYWKEDAYYSFTPQQIDVIEAATEELHVMCLEAASYVIRAGRLTELGVPQQHHKLVADSLSKGAFSLYGRFDFSYDGQGDPKLLEYNADTPTSLLESAVCQWFWLEEVFPELDQFNSLHEKLIERWKALPTRGVVHVASIKGNEEDWVCSTYMMDLITQAGREARHIAVEDIGWNDRERAFVDLAGEPIAAMFKLYPWEWMLKEAFAQNLKISKTTFVEPVWKSLLSCKALLPILWELYPGHRNLLAAYRDPHGMPSYARKPVFSREGANTTLVLLALA